MKARIFKEESLATFDGEGIRYAIFFSGCPLRCVYCHNPESWSESNGYFIDSEEIATKIKRYKPYFKNKGGVTFSGGEPLLQADFIIELSKNLQASGINTALDTSLALFNDKIKIVLDLIDTPIVDIKFYSLSDCLKNVKADNVNLIGGLNYLKKINKPCLFRTVIVPDLNDAFSDIDGYIDFIKPYKTIIKNYELLAFHTLGFDKYEKENIFNPLIGKPSLSREKLNELQNYLNEKLNLGN